MELWFSSKDLPCFTEWIAVCYKSINKSIWIVWTHFFSMRPIAKPSKNQLQKLNLVVAYLSKWLPLNTKWKVGSCTNACINQEYSFIHAFISKCKEYTENCVTCIATNTHTFYQQKILYYVCSKNWVDTAMYVSKLPVLYVPPSSSDVPLGKIKLTITK